MFIERGLKGARELGAHLGVDEDMYRRTAGQAVADARGFVLYGALDEVEKACMLLIKLRELLSDGEISASTDTISRNLVALTLELAPELVHRVECGGLFRQPEKVNAEPGRERERGLGGVAARAVGQQPDRARAAVAAAQAGEERPGGGATRVASPRDDAVRRPQVDSAEEHALGGRAGDRHDRLLADAGPAAAQRREESHQRPVGEQHYVARPHTPPQAAVFSA